MKAKYFIIGAVGLIAGLGGWFMWQLYPARQDTEVEAPQTIPVTSPIISTQPLGSPGPYVGPRGNLPDDAPADYGFWSLAIPVEGILSRSGQPTLRDFKWLRDNNWRSVIDLRVDGERGEVGDDSKIPGFNALGFKYLAMPIIDGHAPTDAQAREFLQFVMDPVNQPVHVHCRGGIGRTGVLVALYRIHAQRWPLEDAVAESRLFQGGISDVQLKWLENWIKQGS